MTLYKFDNLISRHIRRIGVRVSSLFLLASLLCLFIDYSNSQGAIRGTENDGTNRVFITFECNTKGQTFRRKEDYASCTCVGHLQAKCGSIPTPDRQRSVNLDPEIISFNRRPQQHQQGTHFLPSQPAPHPLDPLTASEILKTKETLLGTFQSSLVSFKFNVISLKEPKKADILPYFLRNIRDIPASLIDRKAFVVLIQEGTGHVYEGVVNLSKDVVESFNRVEGGRPLSTVDQSTTIYEAVISHPDVQERCRQLGYDLKLVVPEGLPLQRLKGGLDYAKYGNLTNPYQVFMFGRKFYGDNYYAHPFDFNVIMDETTKQVVGIEDVPGSRNGGSLGAVSNVPAMTSNYDTPDIYNIPGDKPIRVEMPEGRSFQVRGNEIVWQNRFSMRLGFNPREGLVLYNVGFQDGGEFRPILYRAALSEVATVYGDPRPPFHRKYAYDEGNIGFGFATTPLKDQEDCIGNTHLINVTMHNSEGNPVIVPNAICIYEDDAGILWKHAVNRNSHDFNTVVRSHRLNILTAHNFGNYDYLVTWMFHQDASISMKTMLTGIISTNWAPEGSNNEPITKSFATLVAPQVASQFHQHVFAVRLDFEIDGNGNSVHTSEAVPIKNPVGSDSHPNGQGFTTVKKRFTTEGEGCGKLNPASGRSFIITNPSKINPNSGTEVGWKLMPVVDPVSMINRESPIYKQMGFLECDVWVTKYEDEHLYAGGYFLQDGSSNGLRNRATTRQDNNLENEDIVLWHVFSPVHIPRVEDYPVMPVESREMWIKPYNFFLQNPALRNTNRSSIESVEGLRGRR